MATAVLVGVVVAAVAGLQRRLQSTMHSPSQSTTPQFNTLDLSLWVDVVGRHCFFRPFSSHTTTTDVDKPLTAFVFGMADFTPAVTLALEQTFI